MISPVEKIACHVNYLSVELIWGKLWLNFDEFRYELLRTRLNKYIELSMLLKVFLFLLNNINCDIE